MRVLRFCFRVLLALGQAVVFVILPDNPRARTNRCRRYCTRQLRLLGIRPRVRGLERLRPGNGLLVMNHLSWLDPIVVSSLLGADFVTSKEVERDPVLGPICAKAGCVFVNRRSARAAADDHKDMAAALKRHRICIFPEATSTDGERLRDFKPAFFESARLAGLPVQPICLRYRAIDGRRLDRRSRDRVHWYGDMPFAPHLLGLLCVQTMDVELVIFPAIGWQEHDRKSMARTTHDLIEREYHALGRVR